MFVIKIQTEKSYRFVLIYFFIMTRVVIFTVQIISDIQGRCDFQKTCSRFLTKFEINKKPILNNFDISHVRALDKKREIEKNSRLWKISNLRSVNLSENVLSLAPFKL